MKRSPFVCVCFEFSMSPDVAMRMILGTYTCGPENAGGHANLRAGGQMVSVTQANR